MSPDLKRFYQDLHKVLMLRHPASWFDPSQALCITLGRWAKYKDLPVSTMFVLSSEMCLQFRDAGLSSIYPFNADYDSFAAEACQSAMYTNPARLAWIEEHAA